MVTLPVPLPFTLYLLAGLLLATPLLWLALRLPPAQAGWRGGGWPTVCLGIAWGGLLGTGMLGWLRLLHYTHDYLAIPAVITPTDWVVLVLAAPVAEELCFRGALLGGLQRHWSPFWAVVLSAAADVAVHSSQPWLAVHFAVAVGLALAFRSSGSVLTPMIARALTYAVLLIARRHPSAAFGLPDAVLLFIATGSLVLLLLGLFGRRRDAG